jgi:hypothetical protein
MATRRHRYGVLDWEAVGVCLDHVCETRGQDRQAPARNQEHQVQAQMVMDHQHTVVRSVWDGALASTRRMEEQWPGELSP